MLKIGRNDVCPCGSGKKYKKCCGKENIVSVDHLVDKELVEVQKDIFHFAFSRYSHFIKECLEEYINESESTEFDDIFNFYGSLWVITSEYLESGKTILEEYIESQVHHVKRKKTKSIVEQWTSPKPVVASILSIDDNNYMKLKDIITEEEWMVKNIEQEMDKEVGGLVLGILLPADNWKVLFAEGIFLPKGRVESIKNKVLHFYEECDEDEMEFVSDYFLELLNIFIFSEMAISAEEMEWDTETQLQVAMLLEGKIPLYWEEDVMVSMGLILWKKFCEIRKPRIQKPQLFVAAMIYLLDTYGPYFEMLTQAELAEDFNVSSSSISAKFKDMRKVLSEDIEQFEKIISENLEDDDWLEDDMIHNNMEFNEIMNILQDQNHDSLEEVDKFFDETFKGFKPTSKNKFSKKEQAEDVLFNAFESFGPKREQLAKKALKLYPNLPDAYVILSETADDPEELLVEGVKAGERDLGKKFFKENKGHFWGVLETRPYMRAKFHLASYLDHVGRTEEAMEHYKELLKLNPSDNQGVRYELFIAYVEEEMFEEAQALLAKYDETHTAIGAYNQLLVEILRKGPTEKIKSLLKFAKGKNRFVIDYLLGKKKLPHSIPVGYSLGDENEAIIYADQHIHLWHSDIEAIQWLKR